ncbi:MAG: hypothetical protein KAJ03_06350 [Gammaproteobacteria bacterium]|nr:hypothetical protein [Gammaproteobacteria bacterium]
MSEIINPTQSQKLDAFNAVHHTLYLTVTDFLKTHPESALDDAWDAWCSMNTTGMKKQ